MRIVSSVANYLAWACLAISSLLGGNAIYHYSFGFFAEFDESTRRALAAEASVDFFVSAVIFLLAAGLLIIIGRLLAPRRPA
jgi:hypothetical protein